MTRIAARDPTLDLAWDDAAMAACILAVDPAGVGGVVLRSPASDARAAWLDLLRMLLPNSAPVFRMPTHVSVDRLLGGLDLAATLRAGRPVCERGLLAQADGGVVVLAMAERTPSSTVSHLTAVLDRAEVMVERDGLSSRTVSRFGVVALDEGIDDERAASGLRDRLGLHLDLSEARPRALRDLPFSAADVAVARDMLPKVAVSAEAIGAICAAALTLGVGSLRVSCLAVRVACVSAALMGRDAVAADDLALAARLVLSPRATTVPNIDGGEMHEDRDSPPSEDQPGPEQSGDDDTTDDRQSRDPMLDEVVLAAAQAAIPPHLLDQLLTGTLSAARSGSAGRAGAVTQSKTRGRATGVKRGELRGGARLDLIATLRAAAPWQPLRRRAIEASSAKAVHPRVLVSKDDFRVTRFKQRRETATIFVVDASGSAALHRLAEVKGAVELLLADCYVRRDQVALISFRGQDAEILLPPTRSLTRAKRCLASLPGGGGTPLAAGIDAAAALAAAVRRKGQTPAVILMTDGRANVARDGGGRARAEEDALGAARQLGACGFAAMVVDTSPRRQPLAETLAAAMRARYVALPYADASQLSRAVREASL